MSRDTTEHVSSSGGEVVELTAEECFALLASQPIGRLAVAQPGGPPVVLPVNYRLDDKAIVFRSDPGLKVRLLGQSPVSFQVDWIDWHHRTGWSVLVHGSASEAGRGDTDHLQLEPWAAGAKHIWVRIVASAITGRRLLPAEFDWPTKCGYL